MKLNYKRTILVGLAFLSISAFWQLYDGVIPLILKKTFGMNEAIAGVIMAADNVLALFLLPFFGSLSDKSSAKMGKRMPFILFGTGLAVIIMNFLPVFDNAYAAAAAPWKLISFIVVLGFLLVAMGIYRSPAVGLMPDVTPKPLRSRANAVINLMGAVGAIIYLGVTAVLYPESKTKNVPHVDYQPLFMIVAALMFVSVGVLLLTVKERKLTEENQALEKEHPEWNLADDDGSGNARLPAPVVKSLIFLLASICLWYMGYNGVVSCISIYLDNMMGKGVGETSKCLLVATAGATVSYIPIGLLAAKIGRRRTILIGAASLSVCFGICYFLTTAFRTITIGTYVVFALVGAAWAAINVNSLPMVVEMCRGSDIGKFTGYYYTASMVGQVLTPVLAGALLRYVSYRTLFPYAALFVALSFVTMLFVRHGDAVPAQKKDLLEHFDFED